jgi:hypothetical protein
MTNRGRALERNDDPDAKPECVAGIVFQNLEPLRLDAHSKRTRGQVYTCAERHRCFGAGLLEIDQRHAADGCFDTRGGSRGAEQDLSERTDARVFTGAQPDTA